MSAIDCLDKIEILAPAQTVFDVVSNYPQWNAWLPIYNCTLIEKDTVEVGAKVHHQYGYKPLIMSDFVRSIDAIEPGQSIEESYISGDLLGKGVWQFDEADGTTVASYHCMVSSNTVLTHISFFLMGEKAHSNVYKALLKKLKIHCESL